MKIIAITKILKTIQWHKASMLGLFSVLCLSACITQQFDSRTGEPIDDSSYDRTGAGKTRMSLGLEYIKLGDMVNAKFNLEKAEEHLPENTEVLSAIAYFYEQVKNIGRAEDYYERAIEADALSGDTYNNYGTFLCRQKEYERADEMFNRATELANYISLANSFENAGICAKESGDFKKAIAYLEQAIAYDTLRPLSLLTMAQVQLELKDYVQTRLYLSKFNDIAKANEAMLYTWAKLEYEEGHVDSYERVAVKLNELFPNSTYNSILKKFDEKASLDLEQLHLQQQEKEREKAKAALLKETSDREALDKNEAVAVEKTNADSTAELLKETSDSTETLEKTNADSATIDNNSDKEVLINE